MKLNSKTKRLIEKLGPTGLQLTRLSAQMELARRKYEYYFQLANPKAKLYRHTQYLCDKLQPIVANKQHFYIVEMPPQHGKSLTITKTFASYYLMKNPDNHVMISAYSQDLFTKFSQANRRHFQQWSEPLFGLKIGQANSKGFGIKDHEGSLYATSMLGGASGMPADLLIIDDPLKNAEEAASQTIKTKIWDEWNLTFFPRLQKHGSVIVIMTRWQVDDLAGRLLKKMALPWEEIKLPAIACNLANDERDVIGRHNGEALCPKLHDLVELNQHKLDMGSHKFAALYQQAPTLAGGNLFKSKWVNYYVPDRQTMISLGLSEKDVALLPKRIDCEVQAWDTTFKSRDNDDFVAGQTWAKHQAQFYLRPNWVHERLTFTETLDAIRNMSRRFPQATIKLVEDKANGPAIIDTLKKEIPGIMPVSPGADSKQARASSVSPLWEAGQIFLPHPLWVPAIDQWLEEVLGFPNMPHDDNVDAMVYALRRLAKWNQKPIIRF